MRWPCGPLELERARGREGFSAPEAEALQRFCEPRLLDLLSGTPVDCLVVTWAEGTPRDAEQQQALAPLVAAARGRGLAVAGEVAVAADLARAAAAARAAGLAAIVTESAQPASGIELLRFGRSGLAGRERAGFLGVAGLAWPGLRDERAPGADAVSGPTGQPWLDSNAWLVRLAHALVAPRVAWLAFEPPELGQAVAGAGYAQAIADTSVFGARWLVSLDPHLRAGLAAGHAAALESWRLAARALAFFEAHRRWTGFRPVGQIGVVSDYAGANEALACETLNLLARQGSLYRVLVKDRALAEAWDGLDAVVYADAAPAPSELARRLYAFAERGGCAIVPPSWEARGEEDEAPWLPRWRVFRLGRGRLALGREELADPFLLAQDAQALVGHRGDRLRVFNPGLAQLHYVASDDGARGVLHALRFEPPDPRLPTTVWLRRAWTRARALGIAGDAVAVAPRGVEGGVELALPPLPAYGALELSA